MGAVKEELIKIKVVTEGAAEGKAKLAALNKENKAAAAGNAEQAKSVKAVGAAFKGTITPMGGAAAATTRVTTAQAAQAQSSRVVQASLMGVTAAAQPMTLALGGATTMMSGLAAVSRGLGAALNAALGPIGLVVGAIGIAGSAILELREKKEEDRKATAEWAREYQTRSQEIVRARDEVVRAHKNQIDVSEVAAQTAALEHDLELLELFGASQDTILAKQEEIHAAREAELSTSGDILRTDRQVAKLDLERAESALKRLQSEKNRAAAIDDSKDRTEKLRAVEEQILEAQEAVTAAIANQNSVREQGLELTQQQLDLDRKREIEKAKHDRSKVQVAKDEATAAYTGAKDEYGSVPIAAFEGSANQILAAGGTEADVAEVHQKLIEGTHVAKPRSGGSRKPKKEEKVEARFGDYRDVLRAYADSRAGVDAKALDSLAKGVMPKDHKPETSIQIHNENTYTIEAPITVEGAGRNGQAIAQDIAAFFQGEIDKAMKQTPNGLVR